MARAKCAKCRNTDIYVRHHEARRECPKGWCKKEFDGEHLHHFCRVCGFEWKTATQDAKA